MAEVEVVIMPCVDMSTSGTERNGVGRLFAAVRSRLLYCTVLYCTVLCTVLRTYLPSTSSTAAQYYEYHQSAKVSTRWAATCGSIDAGL